MMHDVFFMIDNNKISAFNEWELVLTNVENTLPEPKTTVLDIPCGHGVLDLTDTMTDNIRYDNRKLKLTFEIMNIDCYEETMQEVSNTLHGRTVKVMLSTDCDWYYEGRLTISKWECSQRKGKVVMVLDAYPFKRTLYPIKKRIDLTLVNTEKQTISFTIETKKTIIPTIFVTGELSCVTINNVAFDNDFSEKSDKSIKLKNGLNTFTVYNPLSDDETVPGTVIFKYTPEVL